MLQIGLSIFAILLIVIVLFFGIGILTSRQMYAWAKGGTLVILKDFDGVLYKTIAYKEPFANEMYAHVYW